MFRNYLYGKFLEWAFFYSKFKAFAQNGLSLTRCTENEQRNHTENTFYRLLK